VTKYIVPNWQVLIDHLLYNLPMAVRDRHYRLATGGDPQNLPPIFRQALVLMAQATSDPSSVDRSQLTMLDRYDPSLNEYIPTDVINYVRMYYEPGEDRRTSDPVRFTLSPEGGMVALDAYVMEMTGSRRAIHTADEVTAMLTEAYPHYVFGEPTVFGVAGRLRVTAQFRSALANHLSASVLDRPTLSALHETGVNFASQGDNTIIIDSESLEISLPEETLWAFAPSNHLVTAEDYPQWLRDARNRVAHGARATEIKIPTHDTTQNYDKFRASLSKSHDYLIDTLPIQEHKTRASRRWGIEIETGAGRDLSGTPQGWESKGDGSLESAYGEQWIEPEDCPEYAQDHVEEIEVTREDNGESMTIDNPDYVDPNYCDHCGNVESWDNDDCQELVSPILTSFHSRGLKQITDDLEHSPVSSSAGVHVHVEAKDLTAEQVSNLILIYDRLEPLIEASYRRERRGYCKLRSTRELLLIVRDVRQRRITEPTRMLTGDRYVTVNLQALGDHGTIEFRAMGPVYKYDTLVRWAMFCREIVNVAKAGATAKDALKIQDWEGVLQMFRKFGIELNRAEANEVEEAEVAETAELLAV
jgi:hypothetical protein